jgi:glycosyltransferase involved in cell wall biosynthesis
VIHLYFSIIALIHGTNPMTQQVVDIIIPVFNEEQSLPAFHQRLAALSVAIHPIFIDNASTDNSLKYLRTIEGATIIEHSSNLGYGASLRNGIATATSEKIIIIDADCEYPPEIIPDLIRELDNSAVVHTTRWTSKENTKTNPFKFYGNKIITILFNLLFNQKLTDLYTGCKGYKRSAVAHLDLNREGFEHVLEISARLVRQGTSISEIPITYAEREIGVSKMNHLIETVKYCFLLLFYSISLKKKRN